MNEKREGNTNILLNWYFTLPRRWGRSTSFLPEDLLLLGKPGLLGPQPGEVAGETTGQRASAHDCGLAHCLSRILLCSCTSWPVWLGEAPYCLPPQSPCRCSRHLPDKLRCYAQSLVQRCTMSTCYSTACMALEIFMLTEYKHGSFFKTVQI